MKLISMITGLIGGIFGFILNSLMLLMGATTDMVSQAENMVLIIVGAIGVIFSLVSLVSACIMNANKVVTGVLLIIGATINILCLICAMMVCNTVIFVLFIATIIMLIIGSIFRFVC